MTVRWTSQSGIVEAQTQSQDVSSRGIYFFLKQGQIEKGSQVEIVLTFPDGIILADSTPTRVCCQGRVRRTQAIEPDCIGIAAEIERYRFVRKGEDERSLPRRTL
jgi:hypothetical protein